MNYLKSIFITIISFTLYMTCLTMAFDQEAAQSDSQPVSEQTSSHPIIEPEQPEIVRNELSAWNEHLLSLATVGKYWDKVNNIPTRDWKDTAFDLAINYTKTKGYDSYFIKSSFLDAINVKIAQEEGKFGLETINLISEFNAAVDAQNLVYNGEAKNDTIAEPISAELTIPEEIKPEGQFIESSLVPMKIETPAPTSIESEPISAISESTGNPPRENDLEKWAIQLDKIKTEGKEYQEANALFTETYQLAYLLIQSKIKTIRMIESDLQDALYVRNKRGLYEITIDNFKELFGRQSLEERPFSNEDIQHLIKNQQHAKENQIQQLHDELAKKETSEKIERQQLMDQQMRTDMELKAAILKAQQEGIINTAKSHQMDQKLKAMEQKLATERQDARRKVEEARDMLTQSMQQQIKELHATPAAPKGILTTFTEAVSNWWYDKSDSPQIQQTSQIKEDELLKKLTETQNDPRDKRTIRDAWLTLKNSLLVKTPEAIWDEDTNEPRKEWIDHIKKALETLVLAYHVMPLQDAYNIVESSLKLSAAVKPAHCKKVISILKQFLNQKKLTIDEQREEVIAKKELKIQQKKELEEKIIRKNKKIKDKQEQIKAEEASKLAAAESYKQEKQQWKQMLASLSQDTKATTQKNNIHTEEAIKRSQSLLRLAEHVPSKSKDSLSQKLKQKFTVALLNQQKIDGGNANIHHAMEIFNQSINGMID